MQQTSWVSFIKTDKNYRITHKISFVCFLVQGRLYESVSCKAEASIREKTCLPLSIKRSVCGSIQFFKWPNVVPPLAARAI